MHIKKYFKFGDVDITRPFFIIKYVENFTDINGQELAILSAADLKLSLLVHYAYIMPVLDMMYFELKYYLHDLHHVDPVSYLICHVGTLSNVYSNIRFIYIDKITNKNIFCYLKIRAKQLNIYNNQFLTAVERQYAQVCVDHLFNTCNSSDFNKVFTRLFELIYVRLPEVDGLTLPDSPPNYIKFSNIVSNMGARQFCNILNYLKKIKLIKPSEIKGFLQLFHQIKREHPRLSTH
ncbi:MAG: hypothetical protein PHP53_24395 [Prolixibacteraceae bacterium]|nr:hypothetical protein [Prolixibacteraceae bacterium]